MQGNQEQYINCLVVDDESLGRKLIEDYIDQHPSLLLVSSCRNASEATIAVRDHQIDLMFLDIQMPGLLGTQFYKTLAIPPLAIFVSAYPNYAIEGFDLNAVDYLVKPVGFERFSLAISKAFKRLSFSNNSRSAESKNLESFFVYSEYALVKVTIADIIYVEGMKDYVKIYLDNDPKRVITKSSMKAMEKKLISSSFFRIHKSYIVNLNKIRSIKNGSAMLENIELPISKTKLNDLIRLLT